MLFSDHHLLASQLACFRALTPKIVNEAVLLVVQWGLETWSVRLQIPALNSSGCVYKFLVSLSFSLLPDSSVGKESTCNAGYPGLIPGLGRSPGEGIGYPLQYSWASLGGSAGKESTCNVGDLGSIPGLGRSPGEGIGYIQINETKLCVFPCNGYFN